MSKCKTDMRRRGDSTSLRVIEEHLVARVIRGLEALVTLHARLILLTLLAYPHDIVATELLLTHCAMSSAEQP